MAPPPEPGGWDFRFLTNDAARGWEELCRQAPTNLRRAYDAIVREPSPVTPSAQPPPAPARAPSRTLKGRPLPQWQFEVTSGGRLWYIVDADAREIWLTYAGTQHPKRTE